MFQLNEFHLNSVSEDAGGEFENNKTNSELTKQKPPPTMKTFLITFLLLFFYVLSNLLGGFLFLILEYRKERNSSYVVELKKSFLRNHKSCLSQEQMNDFIDVRV